MQDKVGREKPLPELLLLSNMKAKKRRKSK